VQGFDSQGLNPFAYASNQPASRIDPDGHDDWAIAPAIPLLGGDIPTYATVNDRTTRTPVMNVPLQGAIDAMVLGGMGDTLDVDVALGQVPDLIGFLPEIAFPIVAGTAAGIAIFLPARTANAPTLDQAEPATPTRSIDDPGSLTGATPEEVEKAAEEAGLTHKEPLADGNGTRHSNPSARGRTVQINKGYPDRPGDALHKGPYAKITGKGPTVRIPLAGNPVLP